MRGSGAEIFDAERHRSDWVHRFKSQRRGKEKGVEFQPREAVVVALKRRHPRFTIRAKSPKPGKQ